MNEPATPPVLPSARHLHIPGTPVLKATSLSVQYAGGLALDNITLEVHTVERLAVVGPNGAGKSTLFRVIAGVIKPSSGRVSVYGAEPGGHFCISYIPQRSMVDWNFPVSVEEVVMMGRTRRLGYLRWPGSPDREIVAQALDTVGMVDFSRRQINQLSGGQQQRMFIARALAQEAELMLMDEPVTGLDTPAQEELFKILDSLKQKRVTVMLALHDLKLASRQFDRIMLLNHKLVALGKPDQVLTEKNLKSAYGERIQVLYDRQDLAVMDDPCCGEEDHTYA